MATTVVIYLLLLALTWLTPPEPFLTFLRVYLTLVNSAIAALVLWALFTVSKRPRPVPLPELEKRYEEELKRLMKEWEKVEGSEGGSN